MTEEEVKPMAPGLIQAHAPEKGRSIRPPP